LGYAKQIQPSGDTYFSPNRQVPSPLMFGSIPTGVQRMQPWQTLLFNPRPEDNHPGKISPRDHLIADLFWMPVVEPYAISQPFSTSGKINLNYQIAPFTYINRSTGMHALMKSTRFLALPPSDAPNYKPTPTSGVAAQLAFKNLAGKRYPINIPETLKAFDTKFASSDPANNCFKSASQICEMNLVPFGASASYTSDDASMATFWNTNKLTGDNVREKPYVDIYPRLTTKSNAYTVHVRVQTLKKVPGTPPDQWVTGRDQVLGEYRGASLLERYIDLNDPKLPNFATLFTTNPQDSALSIDQYYRMRVISKKRFAP
jgi:uncharacterized protein (TIGR02600 family)